jgi:hypothetical protein
MTDAYRGLVARSGKSFTSDQILETHERYEAYQEAKTPTTPWNFSALCIRWSPANGEWKRPPMKIGNSAVPSLTGLPSPIGCSVANKNSEHGLAGCASVHACGPIRR